MSAPLSHRFRAFWTVLGTPGRVALAVAAVACVVLLVSLWSLLGAAVTSAAVSDARIAQDQKQQAEKFSKGFEGYLSQINGRSLFFIPSAPPRKDTRVTTEDAAPKAPTRYGGPALIGFANDSAYFSDGRKLRVGDGADSTLKLKAVEPPWSAVVLWEGAEFSISLFDRDRVVFPNPLAPTAAPAEDTSAESAGLVGPPAPERDEPANPARAADSQGTPATARPPESAPKTDRPSSDTTVPSGAAGDPA